MESLKLEIEEMFVQTSERVKHVDLHPTKPWILVSLYSGTVCIWSYQSQEKEKLVKVTESPVRVAKFVTRENWIVVGADDGFVRVYDYETMEMIHEFKAHTDYIRSLDVHPSFPYVLSSSDDKVIKLWNWEKEWECTQVFEGHDHYVMQVAFNPKDLESFASASLDGTIKIWNVDCPNPTFTLDGHSKGINCINYFTSDDELYLISGSDDYTAKVWEYKTKGCVKTLEGHAHNVTTICVPPELPIIITCSEDETIRIWNKTNYRLEKILKYDLQRVWTVGYTNSKQLVFGCDNGTIMVKVCDATSVE